MEGKLLWEEVQNKQKQLLPRISEPSEGVEDMGGGMWGGLSGIRCAFAPKHHIHLKILQLNRDGNVGTVALMYPSTFI